MSEPRVDVPCTAPAMTRIGKPPRTYPPGLMPPSPGRTDRSSSAGPPPRARFRGLEVERSRGQPARLLHDLAVAQQVAGPQRRHPGLARAEEVAGPAELEVLLRDHEPVVGVEPGPGAAPRPRPPSGSWCSSRHADVCAPRPTRPRNWCSCARPNRSACSTTITRRVRHVDADLDDRRRDEDLHLAPAANARMTRSFSLLLQPAVEQRRRGHSGNTSAARWSAISVAARTSTFSDSSTSG